MSVSTLIQQKTEGGRQTTDDRKHETEGGFPTSDFRPPASVPRTLIVGVGNPLLGDEGLGPYVVRHLCQLPMPAEVDVVDCGCDLLNLVSYLPDSRQADIDKPKKIIVLDAIRAGGEPGRIYRFDFRELETVQTKTRSAHQLHVVDVLRLLRKVCPRLHRCEIVVIGIEPKNMELSGDLSEEVRESIADLTRLMREECRIEPVPSTGSGQALNRAEGH